MSNKIISSSQLAANYSGYVVIQNCPLCSTNSAQIAIKDNQFKFSNGVRKRILFSICCVCDEAFLIYTKELEFNSRNVEISTSPNSKSLFYKYLNYCPNSIKSDFEETLKTFDIECYKSCVVMARRTMQLIARDTLSTNSILIKSNNLNDELKALLDNGLILSKTYSMYNKTRKIANSGAHPSDDLDEEITKEDSEQCINCIILFIKEIYEMDELYSKIELNPKIN